MELDRVFETMGINSIAATAESGLKELPECLVPVVRSSVLDFAHIEVDGRSLVVVELPGGQGSRRFRTFWAPSTMLLDAGPWRYFPVCLNTCEVRSSVPA